MNRLIVIIVVIFSFYTDGLLASIFDNGVFSGYKTQQNPNSAFFSNRPSYDSDKPVSSRNNNFSQNDSFSNLDNQNNSFNRFGTYTSRPNMPQSSFNNPPPFSSTTNKKITSQRITGVNDNNVGSSRFNVANTKPQNENIFDSGIPIGNVNNQAGQKNIPRGQVDSNVLQAQMPSEQTRNALDFRNRYNPREIVQRQRINYPAFLLFANDVICTTERGITDGMIFYTPHGTYRLKGNIITSSNDTFMISENKVWLDNMIYFFDERGVILNNRIYNFTNNVMYKEGIRYTIEGSVVTAEGAAGNRRCITSDLVNLTP
ncbi:MAG: hypothetical protein FWE18_05850 [Alphaproteobacteria bacterium]|nr:hypothetical protein [Alphaproteobacteria bacterium]